MLKIKVYLDNKILAEADISNVSEQADFCNYIVSATTESNHLTGAEKRTDGFEIKDFKRKQSVWELVSLATTQLAINDKKRDEYIANKIIIEYAIKDRADLWVTDKGVLPSTLDHEEAARKYVNEFHLDQYVRWCKRLGGEAGDCDYKSFVMFNLGWARVVISRAEMDINIGETITHDVFDKLRILVENYPHDRFYLDIAYENANKNNISTNYNEVNYNNDRVKMLQFIYKTAVRPGDR